MGVVPLEQLVSDRPEALVDVATHYCPGCTHGILHRLVAEVIDELGVRERTVGVAPVGCAVFAYNYFNCDMQQAAHGRAPAVATGIKRVDKDLVVFSYQGDGDLASIGLAEAVHAALRSERITIVFVNNAIYGMTGGQMAPTTLPGQRSTTSGAGRDVQTSGYPIKVCEMLATQQSPAYIARVALVDNASIVRAKRAIKEAFTVQVEDRGFSLVEVLSTCPTNFGMSPKEAMDWVKETMIPYYPLGVFKRPEGGAQDD